MLRYRIARNVSGRHVVFAVSISVVPINETYATRAQAQGTADWLNSLSDKEPPEKALPLRPSPTEPLPALSQGVNLFLPLVR